jgi:hypothetical protein
VPASQAVEVAGGIDTEWSLMFALARSQAMIAVAAVLVCGLAPVGGQAASAAASPGALSGFESRRGPILFKTFWSVILRMVITVSRHASSRMVARGVSDATLRRVLTDGKVVSRSGGVTRIRSGGYEARVNSSTGNVITVIRIGKGGGGR